MFISLCAKSKILQLTLDGKCFRILSSGNSKIGSHIDLIPNDEITNNDVMVSHIPKVVADLNTINELLNQNIDFDYDTQEFIISRRGIT